MGYVEMNLDTAIKHCWKVHNELHQHGLKTGQHLKQEEEYAELACWLEELKRYRTSETWVKCSDGLPEPFISVQAYMPDEEPFPVIHESYVDEHGNWHSAIVYDVKTENVVAWKYFVKPMFDE